ncbi:hypothetical protein [Streptomyces cyaneofuscatus]|uniref:hypothetical protein n=1 Tax=Streptomyces cyaneofuscatus TaxID=66883 RepID=UPI002FF1E0BF
MAVCTLAALTACSPSEPADEKASGSTSPTTTAESSPSPAPTKSVSPEEEAQGEAIVLYRAYWQELERLYADEGADTGELKEFAVGEALVSAQKDIKDMHGANQVITGKVLLADPTVTKAEINTKIPKVYLSTCLDVRKWKVTTADTGKPLSLPSTRLTKYIVEATVEK